MTTEILDGSIHYGVGIKETGTLRMLGERETITLKIPLEEYLTTLDSLQANVEDLLESDTLEEEKAFTLQSGGITLTVLKGLRDPNETPKLCSTLNLKMLILSDILQMDWDPRINHLVTGTSLTLMGNNVYCNRKADRFSFKYLALVATRSGKHFLLNYNSLNIIIKQSEDKVITPTFTWKPTTPGQ